MRKTPFIAMLAAALLGCCGTALANTGYSQDKPIARDNAPNEVYGVSGQEKPGAANANLFIFDDAQASHESLKNVIGGYATNETSAFDNKVTMSGGKVTELLVGGYATTGGQALDNSVVMTGGEMTGLIAGGYVNGNGNADRNTVVISSESQASQVYGGYTGKGHANSNTVTLSGGHVKDRLVGGASIWEGNACGNSVIVTGGSVENVCGAFFTKAQSITGNKVLISGGNVGTARAYTQRSSMVEYADNVIIMSGGTAGSLQFAERIHLAGAGFNGNIEGVENIAGQALNCGTVGSCDSIGIYGSQISGSSLSARVALNFHLMNGLLTEDAPMVTLGGTLSLSKDLTLSFDALDNMEWKPGDSVTLVNAGESMGIAPELLDREYNIYRYGDPAKTIMATARLELNQDNTVLKLTVQGIPEPATVMLGLPALAGLAARRRRMLPAAEKSLPIHADGQYSRSNKFFGRNVSKKRLNILAAAGIIQS